VGRRIDAAQSSSPPLPFFCFEAYLSCLTTHASSSSTGIGSCESTFFFSSVPNGPLTRPCAFNDVCFLVTLTQSLLSSQLHSYDSTAWCANLNCVHSSISFYRRTSKCCLVVNYTTVQIAPLLILSYEVVCTSAHDAAIGHPPYLCLGQALRRSELEGPSLHLVGASYLCTLGLIIKNTVHYSAFRNDESPDCCSLFIYKFARLQCRSPKTRLDLFLYRTLTHARQAI
jgi:hypothetical protein